MIVGQINRLEAVSENLANSTQPGYRRIQASHRIFDLIYRQATASQLQWKEGERYDPIDVDFSQGALRNTERPLDFALSGDGFFVLEKDGKELYTRDGSFSVDPDGRLINSGNLIVKGKNGEITIPPKTNLSAINVGPDGTIRSNGRVIDTLQLAHFADNSKLNRVGPALFSTPNDMKPDEMPTETQVIGRTLETSNTTLFAEMAELISCVRAFESCQRMIKTQDEAAGRMIQQLS